MKGATGTAMTRVVFPRPVHYRAQCWRCRKWDTTRWVRRIAAMLCKSCWEGTGQRGRF